jgi:hypothetical protein
MRRILFLTLLCGIAACGDSKPTVKMSEALPILIVPPGATILSKEAGEDALKVHLRSDQDLDAVSKFYRDALTRAQWKLVSDAPAGAGALVLYAERSDGHSMWITIRKPVGAAGSEIDIAGVKTPKP